MIKSASTLFILLFVTISVFIISTNVKSKDHRSHKDITGRAEFNARAEELKHTIVTPHLKQKISKGINVLWCNTFQLTWNELIDLVGEPIRMVPPSPVVAILNKKTATKIRTNPIIACPSRCFVIP